MTVLSLSTWEKKTLKRNIVKYPGYLVAQFSIENTENPKT